MRRDPPIVSDWYAAMLGDREAHYASASSVLDRRGALLRGLAGRVPFVRGLLLAAAPAPVIAIKRGEPGATTLLAAEALRRRRRVVLLEFIGRPRYGSAWKRALDRTWRTLVEGPAMRRAMLAAQVLTEPESALYAQRYGLDRARIRHVPWALSRTATRDNLPAGSRSGVVSSGRAFCDWDTLIAAQRGREWGLTIICDRPSAARLGPVAEDASVSVLADIPRDEHDAIVERAAVYVVCLEDPGVSAGQVRLMTAVELGTPVVATRGPALDGYLEDGVTALAVAPRDPAALRSAIEGLLADERARRELASAALGRGRGRTYPDYFADVGDLIDAAAAQPSAGGTSSRSEWSSSAP